MYVHVRKEKKQSFWKPERAKLEKSKEKCSKGEHFKKKVFYVVFLKKTLQMYYLKIMEIP